MDIADFQDHITIRGVHGRAVDCRHIPGTENVAVVYFGGFGSHPWNPVADMFADYCRERGHSFTGFVYSGDRSIDGGQEYLKNFTVGGWRQEAEAIWSHTAQQPGIDTIVAIGTSNGANFATDLAIKHPGDAGGVVLTAPAFDIDKNLLPLLFMFDPDKEKSLRENGWFDLPVPSSCAGELGLQARVTSEIIEDALRHRTFADEHQVLYVPCPMVVVHSTDDNVVPFPIAQELVTQRIRCATGTPELHTLTDAGHSYDQPHHIEFVGGHFENVLQTAVREARRPTSRRNSYELHLQAAE
ncbi:MAG: alpha/beta hydrolase [Alphaproteobacteria bacterium]|nr:alpha/beta hydrolase [Alphaproteobacteria bacterium]